MEYVDGRRTPTAAKTPLPKVLARSRRLGSSSESSSVASSPSSVEPNNKRGLRSDGAPPVASSKTTSTATTPQLATFLTEKGFVDGSVGSRKRLKSPRMKCECDTTSGAAPSYWTSRRNSAHLRSTAVSPSRRSAGSHHSAAASRASHARPPHKLDAVSVGASSSLSTASVNFFSQRLRMSRLPVSNPTESKPPTFFTSRHEGCKDRLRSAGSPQNPTRAVCSARVNGDAHTASTFSNAAASSRLPR